MGVFESLFGAMFFGASAAASAQRSDKALREMAKPYEGSNGRPGIQTRSDQTMEYIIAWSEYDRFYTAYEEKRDGFIAEGMNRKNAKEKAFAYVLDVLTDGWHPAVKAVGNARVQEILDGYLPTNRSGNSEQAYAELAMSNYTPYSNIEYCYRPSAEFQLSYIAHYHGPVAVPAHARETVGREDEFPIPWSYPDVENRGFFEGKKHDMRVKPPAGITQW